MGAVLFAGTNDVLGFTQTGALSAWTVFVVCGGLNVATNVLNYAVALTGAGCILGGTDGTYGALAEFQTGAKYLVSSVEPTGWGVDCFQPAHIYRDNTEVAYAASVGTLDLMNFTDLGGRNDIANLGMIGYFGEGLIYAGNLSAPDRTSVHTYLKKRWNTP
jgi:hypothetical protein